MNIREFVKSIIWHIYNSPTIIIQALDGFIKRRRCDANSESKLYLTCSINNRQPRSSVTIGNDSRIFCKIETYRRGGAVHIGTHCFIGENTRLWSSSSIKIGDRVLISHDVNIHDTNSHSMSAGRRHLHFMGMFHGGAPDAHQDVASSSIVIEDDAWIGFGSAVFKGVTVGRGAIVAAMSVVTKDVPPYTIVAGNPARMIGTSHP